MEKEKAHLELVEAEYNLKLAEIKKNKIPRSSSSISDNNKDKLGLIHLSKKYSPEQSYDRSFCKDKLDKNSYQYYQIPVDNKKSNESFRDETKSEINENKTSNSATVIEPVDRFIDELLEGQEASSSELDPISSLESPHLPPVDFLSK